MSLRPVWGKPIRVPRTRRGDLPAKVIYTDDGIGILPGKLTGRVQRANPHTNLIITRCKICQLETVEFWVFRMPTGHTGFAIQLRELQEVYLDGAPMGRRY